MADYDYGQQNCVANLAQQALQAAHAQGREIARDVTPVQKRIQALDDADNRLSRLLDTLAQKLSPVMAPDMGHAQNDSSGPSTGQAECPLSEMLKGFEYRLESRIDTVNYLIRHIEL